MLIVGGYECPDDTCPQAIRVLRKLKRDGVVIFNCDGGPSSIALHQLSEIAGAIGLECFDTPYKVVIVDDNQIKAIDGATNVRPNDYPNDCPA